MTNHLYTPYSALLQVSPVNSCTLTDLINILLQITVMLIGEELRTSLTYKLILCWDA